MTPKYSDLPAASAQTAFRRIIWGTVHSGSESSCNNLLLQSSDIRLRHSTATLRSDPDGCRAAIEAKGFVAKVPELPRYQNRSAFVLHVLEISALALETKAEFPQGENFVDLHHIYQTVRHSRTVSAYSDYPAPRTRPLLNRRRLAPAQHTDAVLRMRGKSSIMVHSIDVVTRLAYHLFPANVANQQP